MDMTVGQNVFVVDYKSKKMVPVLAFKTGTEVYPLAYFRGSSLGGTNAYGDGTNPEQLHFDDFDEPGWSELGCIAPYAEMGTSAANATWYEPKKYQLIHPGLDGNFGDDSDGGFRSIGNDQYKQADLDNISNIAGFDEIETLIP